MKYWRKVAAMLGLEIDERFRLINVNSGNITDDVYQIKEGGIVATNRICQKRIVTAGLLEGVFSGSDIIKHVGWVPKHGDVIWRTCISNEVDDKIIAIPRKFSERDASALVLLKHGMLYKTEEEALSPRAIRRFQGLSQAYKENTLDDWE